jgi:hypothetical protein|tara:strand:+ start:522 stop:761 length:240 start_codon:yes stop_codon:yes gene_type:complete
MTRTKLVDGVRINFTAEEETARDAEEAQVAIEKAAHDADHIWKRKAEYPTIEECVHAILDDGLVELQEKRAAVKARFPK